MCLLFGNQFTRFDNSILLVEGGIVKTFKGQDGAVPSVNSGYNVFSASSVYSAHSVYNVCLHYIQCVMRMQFI